MQKNCCCCQNYEKENRSPETSTVYRNGIPPDANLPTNIEPSFTGGTIGPTTITNKSLPTSTTDREIEEEYMPQKKKGFPKPPIFVATFTYTPTKNTAGQPTEPAIQFPLVTTYSNNETGGTQSVTPSWLPGNGLDWKKKEWDGIPLDYEGKTPQQICQWMYSGYAMKGLKQWYDEVKPFANEAQPTMKEVDAWNVNVIRHFRRLLGIDTEVVAHEDLFMKCWFSDRRYSGLDRNVPPDMNDTAYGPCVWWNGGGWTQGSNAHCGALYKPSGINWNVMYTVNNGYPAPPTAGPDWSEATEGIATVNTNLPWALKLSAALSQFVCNEGLGGHAGPFTSRTQVGMSFWDRGRLGGTGNGTTLTAATLVRVKFRY